ncbi:MAG: twin-arginine translocase TatA/TatE family subunit [Deltaproteobacteria bacterium]|nr:twin-arginine translocase TatA/TatE family subunit [Deltaproteobacteria bacterium]
MFGLGIWELIVILVIVVLLFGARRLPEIGAGIGDGIKNFRKSMKDDKTDKTEKTDKTDKTEGT